MNQIVSASLLCILATSVAAAEPSTQPATAPTTAPVVEVQPDGSLLFKAEGARVIGYKMHLENKPEPTLVRWVDNRESITWPKGIAHHGRYEVEITYSCPDGAGGGFAVAAGAHKVEAHTEPTADWKTYRSLKLSNTLEVLNDNTTLILRAPNWIDKALMNFRSIKLTPVLEPEKDKK